MGLSRHHLTTRRLDVPPGRLEAPPRDSSGFTAPPLLRPGEPAACAASFKCFGVVEAAPFGGVARLSPDELRGEDGLGRAVAPLIMWATAGDSGADDGGGGGGAGRASFGPPAMRRLLAPDARPLGGAALEEGGGGGGDGADGLPAGGGGGGAAATAARRLAIMGLAAAKGSTLAATGTAGGAVLRGDASPTLALLPPPPSPSRASRPALGAGPGAGAGVVGGGSTPLSISTAMALTSSSLTAVDGTPPGPSERREPRAPTLVRAPGRPLGAPSFPSSLPPVRTGAKA